MGTHFSFDRLITLADFALGAVFLLHFLLRWVAAEQFSSFLLSVPTLVDCVTLGPLFLTVWRSHTWLGLRFFR